jgi:gas vesicle protein
MKSGSLFLGLLAGACLGVAGGLLFAPHKGSVTRKMIARRGDDYIDILQERFDDFIDTIDGRLDNVKKDVTDFIKRGIVNAYDVHKPAKATLN